METRYKMLTKTHPELAEKLMLEAQKDVEDKVKMYEQWLHKIQVVKNNSRGGLQNQAHPLLIRKLK
jgi:hypothetical protein